MSCLSESTALATRLNQSSETQNYGSKTMAQSYLAIRLVVVLVLLLPVSHIG